MSDVSTPFGIDVARFSSFCTLVRVSALCARFLSRLRQRKRPGGADGEPLPTGPLTVSEVTQAKLLWLRHIQDSELSDCKKALAANQKHNLIQQLNLYLDNENIIRCRGRLENSEFAAQTKYPILIPKGQFARLIIADCHRDVLHAGVNHTLSRVRYEYWIPQGRSMVKSFISRCYTCKRHHGGPYRAPEVPPLPTARVSKSQPFSHVGLDYFGPLYIKNQSSSQKAWVCLITCMVTRAVHLELVDDFTSAEFLMAFRRFVARRGTPVLVISDNAPPSFKWHTFLWSQRGRK